MIQLYSKHTQVYLALADGGGVVGMTDSNHKNSESVLCVKYVGGIIIRTKVYTVLLCCVLCTKPVIPLTLTIVLFFHSQCYGQATAQVSLLHLYMQI